MYCKIIDTIFDVMRFKKQWYGFDGGGFDMILISINDKMLRN